MLTVFEPTPLYLYEDTIPIRVTEEDAYKMGLAMGKRPYYFLHMLFNGHASVKCQPYYGA